MTDARHLAGEMARTFSALAPPAAADSLRRAAARWHLNAAAPAPPPSARTRRRLDEFFQPAEVAPLLGTAMKVWRALPWRLGGGGRMPDGIAAAELLGADGVAACDSCRAGVLFQSASCFYAWHRHAAEEFYLPLSGAAAWMAAGRPPAVIAPPAAALIHHAPHQPHAMQTSDAPLLALWLWTGDLSFDSYTLCHSPCPEKPHDSSHH